MLDLKDFNAERLLEDIDAISRQYTNKRYFYMTPVYRETIEEILEPAGLAKIDVVDGKEYLWGAEVVNVSNMGEGINHCGEKCDEKDCPWINWDGTTCQLNDSCRRASRIRKDAIQRGT